MDDANRTVASTSAKEDFDREVKLYELYRDYVKHEDSLRGQRTGWLLTIQGFLFAALGVVFNAKASHPDVPLRWLLSILAILGVLVSISHSLRYHVQNRVYISLENRMKNSRNLIRRGEVASQDARELASSKNKIWDETLPDIRYGGAYWASLWLVVFAYHNIFIVLWISLFAINLFSNFFK